jgi:hypothetical protein
MSKDERLRERLIERAVELLRGKPEAERDVSMEDLELTSAEKAEVRKQLWEASSPLPARPEALRSTQTFQRLVQDVRQGKAILFLGSGVSQDVGMPPSGDLVEALRALTRSYNIQVDKEHDYTLPEIADALEKAGLHREVIGILKDRIEDAYHQEPPPHEKGAYRLIPYLSELNKLIFTTNWDDLVKLAFRAASESVETVRHDQDIPHIAPATHTVVKLHGDFSDPATLVVSSTDYAKIIETIKVPGGLAGSLWGMVSARLAESSFIFVGYRLADEDIKLLKSLIAARQLGAEPRNYMVGPFDESEQQGLKDWQGIDVIPAGAREFFIALAQELAEFANRRDDLRRIFREDATAFLEFCAPFGSGKSALIDEIERQARGEGWKDEQIIRIDLRQEPPPLTVAMLLERMAKAIGNRRIKQGEKLRQVLVHKRRLLILIENTEAVEEGWPEFITFVSQVVAPAVKEADERGQPIGKRSRLILSGRYPVEGWPYITFKRHAEFFSLYPFTLNAVREMVGKYTLFQDPRAEISRPSSRLVEQIYGVTGRSHPGFIKEILDDLMEKSKQPDSSCELPSELTEPEIDSYLASFVKTIRKEVWSTAHSIEIEELFARGLCVLRKMNASVLERLAHEQPFSELIMAIGKPEDVIASLKKCRILAYEYPLEIVDPVIRRIHCQVLERDKEEPGRFALAHNAAALAWNGLLSSVEDLTQLSFFQEWLYHYTTYLQLDSKTEKKCWETLQETVKAIQFRTSQQYRGGMGETLLHNIEERNEQGKDPDGELLNALLACLGETYYEDFRQLLIAKQEITQ